ncbi:MAG: ectoine/hydroxyectoine ABC transporter permease subunit EhuD [Methylobacteriaceae bacterium]|jgi:polar amino acid transport system permease protein|nr:ectoine/hydroxyectoine ABC transporter permease subunit EhuD [Methylobacteriaceae bacterium]
MTFDVAFAWSILPSLLKGLAVTFQVVVLGFVAALCLGLTLAVLRHAGRGPVPALTRAYVMFISHTPLLVQLFFLYFVLPQIGLRFSAMTTGILGLGLYFGAYIAEAWRGAIEDIHYGQWEAARALDLPPLATWIRIILPQTVKPMLPVLGNYLIGMFKETPLLAMITIPELFQITKQIADLTYNYNETYTLLGLLFLLISVPSSLLFQYLEKRSHGKSRVA